MLRHDNSPPPSVIPFLVQSNELSFKSYHNPCHNLRNSENCGVRDVTPYSLVEASLYVIGICCLTWPGGRGST